MADLQPPKGTFDILPRDPDPQEAWRNSDRWQYVESVIRQLATDFGFREIRTPVFERAELFHKSSGQSSDIVTKEMYTFNDKGDRAMTLRPEGTPPVLRAFIDKQLQQQAMVHKFFYIAPMFRYDRPQAGRYRQHHQFGTEVIGNGTPQQDVEVIELMHTFYTRLGICDLKVAINSLGTPQCRLAFRDALKTYFAPHLDQLSDDSQVRYEVNPLRILDSKDPADRALLAGAPKLSDYLSEEAQIRFARVCALLKQAGIPFEVQERLVRGLDYYNHTVFEMMTHDVTAQSSLGGGGRYDGLLKNMGGPDLPSIGFGIGLERVIRTMQQQECPFPAPSGIRLYIIPLGDTAVEWALQQARQLRARHVAVEIELGERKLKNALRAAEELGARQVLVVGDNELQQNCAQLRTMATRHTEDVALDTLQAHFIS